MTHTHNTEEERDLREEIERVAQFAYERLAFADYPHCETVYADTAKVHEVTNKIRALKDTILSHFKQRMEAIEEEIGEVNYKKAVQVEFEDRSFAYAEGVIQERSRIRQIINKYKQ